MGYAEGTLSLAAGETKQVSFTVSWVSSQGDQSVSATLLGDAYRAVRATSSFLFVFPDGQVETGSGTGDIDHSRMVTCAQSSCGMTASGVVTIQDVRPQLEGASAMETKWSVFVGAAGEGSTELSNLTITYSEQDAGTE